MDARTRANVIDLPLLVCVIALAVAALVLGMLATGLVGVGGSGTPAWHGVKAPPGAVGLGPERSALRGR
jgi:hypothetical protein